MPVVQFLRKNNFEVPAVTQTKPMDALLASSGGPLWDEATKPPIGLIFELTHKYLYHKN